MTASSEFLFVADDEGVAWLHVESGKRFPVITGGAEDTKKKGDEDDVEEFTVPEDISREALDDAALEDLRQKAQAALDLMTEASKEEGFKATPVEVQAARDLSAAVRAIKTEQAQRVEADEQVAQEFAEALASANDEETSDDGADGGDGDDGSDGGEDGGDGGEAEASTDVVEEGELTNASSRGPTTVVVPKRSNAPKLNPTLAEIARRQPAADLEHRPELHILAASDVPGFSNGQDIDTMDDLVKATTERCKALGNGPHFVPLAKIRREFPMVLDADSMTPQQMREAWEGMLADQYGTTDLSDGKAMEALVAAGGWCAPSEIRYDFFQISEVAGLVDLPTFGVKRGGLKWPQSLSLFDFFALAGAPASGLPTNATMPWEWTEVDDILAATGSPQKACLRPPCPGFDEARLRVFGLCITAGNLTEDAFPELIRHFMAQTVVAHNRSINRRMLLQMAAASTLVDMSSVINDADSAVNAFLGSLDLQATDYREKHGMRDTAVLEAVAPSWLRGLLRSDFARKNGLELFDVADSYIQNALNVRNIRAQWVQDWQTRLATGIAPVGGAAPTAWPTSVDVILSAPGTFGRGNGMTLDLGVVRDSTLNKSNDHTAAWSEEATLLAKFGHESRVVRMDLRPTGNSGAQTAAITGP